MEPGVGKGAERLDPFVHVWDGPWSPDSSVATPRVSGHVLQDFSYFL